ncbi:MAG: arsenate reductase (glutaredoxin) [Epsilonproteobacteria bacterium]|nr:arsenate reductase (glutaredoxin) [Campylobacterota bacterium]
MESIKIWHNPNCSKSREAFFILEENNCDKEVFKYLDEKLTKDELKKVLKMLGFQSVREWMRTKEDIYKELNLKDETDEEKLLDAMVLHPKLIERPVIIKGNKAIIGRPTSIIAEFVR